MNDCRPLALDYPIWVVLSTTDIKETRAGSGFERKRLKAIRGSPAWITPGRQDKRSTSTNLEHILIQTCSLIFSWPRRQGSKNWKHKLFFFFLRRELTSLRQTHRVLAYFSVRRTWKKSNDCFPSSPSSKLTFTRQCRLLSNSKAK